MLFPMSLGFEPSDDDNVNVADDAGEAVADFESMEPPTIRRRLYTQEVKNMWNLIKVYKALGTREKCIEFCENYGLIPSSKICIRHHTPMSIRLREGQSFGYFYCTKSSCHSRCANRETNTWFENVRIPLPRVFYLMYAFARNWPYDVTMHEDFTDGPVLTQGTITDCFNHCREVIVIDHLGHLQRSGMIGGPGVVVQFDESKFGERECNRGRQVDGHWVLGMVEEGSQRIRLEVCPDNDRTADAIIPLIVKHVAPGSIIHTDGREAYNSLGNFCVYGYTHKKVNRTDPDNPFVAKDGAHTQTIMAQWRSLKNFFCNRPIPPEQLANMIIEYQWQHYQEAQKNDVFERLLQCIKRAYPIK